MTVLPAPCLTETVRAAAAGDERAWEALVQRFTPMLRHVARGYRLPAHDVDDVVQTCWLLALRHLPSLRDPEAVGGWLLTTARRQSLRAHQQEVRELLCETERYDTRPSPDCLETTVVTAERVAALRDAVGRLPGRQRAVLESMIERPDLSYADVSAGLDMPIGSIGPTRERGLDRLRRDDRLCQVVAT